MGDMSLPADYPTVPTSVYDDAKLVKLAREIAMGIKSLPEVLFDNSISQKKYAELLELPHFQRLLASEVSAWASAMNTAERVKLKSSALIEEYLPELYARLNDQNEPLSSKVKAIEVVAKLAHLGEKEIAPSISPGDRVQVIINMGADAKLQYDKRLPPKVIDAVVNPPVEDTPASAEELFADSIDLSKVDVSFNVSTD